MVLVVKWMPENNLHARIAIITDRDELDKQIERVFKATGERPNWRRSRQALGDGPIAHTEWI